MSVSIKSAHEIELMRESCRRLSIVHKELEEATDRGFLLWILTDWAKN